MTPQELKNSILQMAIQGKLVEQRPEEGTAEELYQQIQEEKQRLIAEKKIRKDKPLPEITDDEKPFEIPESWKWVRLEAITYSVGNKDNQILAKEVKSAGAFPAVSQGAALIDGFCDNVDKVINDLPLVMFGDHTRNVKYIDFPFVISADGTKFMKVVLANPLYLYYWMKITAEKLRNRGYARHFSLLKKEAIPLPPLAEQKRIVSKIEQLLPLIDRYEAAWTKLEAFNKRFPEDMQKSILQEAIQGKLVEQRPEEGTGEELYQQIQAEKQRLIAQKKIKKDKPLPEITDDEKPFDIPDSWKWVRLLSVVEIATNLVCPDAYVNYKHIAPDNIEKGTGKLLEVRTVGEDKVSSSNHLFFSGQIIYSKIRPLLKKAIIAPYDGLCSADMYPLNVSIDSKFALYYMLSNCFNSQIADAMSSRVKMPKINQKELSAVLLPLPPLAEQKRIVAKIEQLLPLCEKLK